MTVEVFTAFYGPVHWKFVQDTLLPSLAQDSNLPELERRGHRVVHRIYCPPDQAAEVARANFKRPVRLNTECLSASTDRENRIRLGLCFQDAIQRGNLVIVAQADLVFGHGLADAVQDLRPGDYLVCAHPRVNMEAVESIRGVIHGAPSAPRNAGLVRLFMESIAHPMVEHGKKHGEPYWRTTRRADHWETYFQEPPPLAFIGTPDMLDCWQPPHSGPLEVVDHELPNYCFGLGRLKAITDSRVFFWGELTDCGKYLPTIPANFETLASCRHFNTHPVRWFFQ